MSIPTASITELPDQGCVVEHEIDAVTLKLDKNQWSYVPCQPDGVKLDQDRRRAVELR